MKYVGTLRSNFTLVNGTPKAKGGPVLDFGDTKGVPVASPLEALTLASERVAEASPKASILALRAIVIPSQIRGNSVVLGHTRIEIETDEPDPEGTKKRGPKPGFKKNKPENPVVAAIRAFDETPS